MKNKTVRSFEFVVGRKKTINYPLPTTHPYRQRAAFTLVELLIAITIIAILIGAGTYTWINGQEKGRDGKRKNDLKEVQKALELYAHAEGSFPSSSNGKIFCKINSADAAATEISWGSEFKCNDTTYMQKLPKDTNGSTDYYYYFAAPSTNAAKTNYIIWAKLENKKDRDRCDLGGPIYCYQNTPAAIPACGFPDVCDYFYVYSNYFPPNYFVINQ